MPRVTVCLAVYNGEATLAASLQSVRDQTFKDFDILVLDDGSTDRSGDIAQAFGAKVVRQPNAGLGAARKRMVEEASGDYIAFIDADDIWLPNKLEVQMAVLEETEAALCHADGWYVYEDGREVARDLDIPRHADSFDHIIPSNRVIASTAVFMREAMLDVGNFIEGTVRCSDWYGWFILASKYPFVHIPQKLVRYQVLSTSLANAGYRFHEAQRYLLEQKILPEFDEIFQRVEPLTKSVYKKLLNKDLAVAISSMAKHLDQQGRKQEARRLHREAIARAPGVFRIWSRMIRSYLR